MNITYNGLPVSSASSLVCLSDVPNILKISDASGGTKAEIVMEFSGGMATIVSKDAEFYISVFDEQITNVLDYNNAVNKSFYISNDAVTTAAYVAKALRCCPNIVANWNIMCYGNEVRLSAKDCKSYGNNIWILSNIPAAYFEAYSSDGSSDSPLQGQLIDIDIFTGNTADSTTYITTLEKTFYDGECAFDLSPVLASLAKYGETTQFRFFVSTFVNGVYVLEYEGNVNYITVGYMCNMGQKYLNMHGGIILAENVSRGTEKAVQNNTLLYVYEPSIDMSIYAAGGGMSIYIRYLDSAMNVLYEYSDTWRYPFTANKLFDLHWNLEQQWLHEASYVDVLFGSSTYRYKVIKPFNMTEGCTRIYWRNSYGGKSFFDFCGSRTENHTSDVTTFQKNIFDYYDSNVEELNKVYSNGVEYEVTLKSHLMEKDGIWQMNDLLQSKNVWIMLNNKEYKIIIDSIEVNEQNNADDIFEAVVKFHYSLPNSF